MTIKRNYGVKNGTHAGLCEQCKNGLGISQEKTFDSGCAGCLRKKAAGLRTGDEPAPGFSGRCPASYRKSIGVHFRGSLILEKVLLSAGLHASKVTKCREADEPTWECDTERGKRWVVHAGGGWRVEKVPPGKEMAHA